MFAAIVIDKTEAGQTVELRQLDEVSCPKAMSPSTLPPPR